jgi:hypothetical protein
MNTILLVCAVAVTVALVIAVIFLISTLSQIRRTARQAEILLSSLNQEMCIVGRITESISSFFELFASPWVKVGGWAAGLLTMLQAKRKKADAAE